MVRATHRIADLHPLDRLARAGFAVHEGPGSEADLCGHAVADDSGKAIATGRLLIDSVTPAQTFSSAVPDLPPGTWVKDADRYPEPFTALGASVAAPAISTA